MKLTDGMFLRCAKTVHDTSYTEIEYEQLIIDAGCMKLVQDPSRFEILLGGRAGVGGTYDLWRRLKAKLRGESFQAAHGANP
jgi:hypothetical protein